MLLGTMVRYRHPGRDTPLQGTVVGRTFEINRRYDIMVEGKLYADVEGVLVDEVEGSDGDTGTDKGTPSGNLVHGPESPASVKAGNVVGWQKRCNPEKGNRSGGTL